MGKIDIKVKVMMITNKVRSAGPIPKTQKHHKVTDKQLKTNKSVATNICWLYICTQIDTPNAIVQTEFLIR